MTLTPEQRSQRAKDLINDPVLTEIINSVKAEALADWVSTGMTDSEKREAAWHRYVAVQIVVDKLHAAASDAAVRKFNARKVPTPEKK